MGWAIKRADGTYRAWNAHTQDDTLQTGETWVSLAAPPDMPTPPKPPNPLKAMIVTVLADVTVPASLKALLTEWRAQL